MLDFGALVISLDFELHWGVRDRLRAQARLRQDLLESRRVIPEILELFEQSGVAATWAVVGFLCARSRSELERFSPLLKPHYRDPALDPYQEQVGLNEEDDPLHFAPSLIRRIRDCPRQEIACHTFSHYYCQEPGQNKAAFAADIDSAVRIAGNSGVPLKSIVFPRDQVNPAYRDVLLDHGIVAYRGNQHGWMYRSAERRQQRQWMRRAARLCDAYVPVSGLDLGRWDGLIEKDGLCNVRACAYLRPYRPALRAVDALRLQRIAAGIKAAALSRRIFHLWCHPHEFGRFPAQSLQFLRAVLAEFSLWKARAGLRSLNLQEVAALIRGETTA